MKTLENLFLDQLAGMYEAEQEIAKALSRMTRLASSHELQEALKVHSYETLQHISKVARVFECFGEPTASVKGSAIGGLLAEGYTVVSQYEESPASDAAIICAVQKLEHYEIASYGCLRDWAEMLNNHEAAMLLEEILDEEKSGDHKLTHVAQLRNIDALGAVEGRGEREGEETSRALR
jgi:ferritin-like metal-binding protein YciE